MMIASIIPGVGPALVWVPAVIYPFPTIWDLFQAVFRDLLPGAAPEDSAASPEHHTQRPSS